MVNKLFSNSKNLFLSRQNSILSAAMVLMATVFLSRILGLVRARMINAYFAPEESAVYFAAFRLPDMIYNLLIFGALSVAFIPVFSSILSQKGKKEAFNFASTLLSIGLVLFAAASLIGIIFARPVSYIVAPGFNEVQLNEMASLTRILFFSQLLFVIGACLTSILQTFKHFLIPSLGGVLYNIGIITGIVALTPYLGIYGPVGGVLIGSILYVGVHLPLVRKIGYRFKFNFDYKNKDVRRVFKLMLPRTIAIAGEQLRMTLNISLASLISASSVTIFTFAQQLYLVPVGLFISTMAQATLPVLSLESAKDQVESFRKTLATSLHQVLFLTLPAAAILIVLRIPVVRLAFGASEFDWTATVLTGKTVAWLACGLAFESMVVMFVRAFYALHDTLTPVKVAFIALFFDMLFSVMFIFVLGWDIWSLGLSATIGGGISAVLLFLVLDRKIGGLFAKEFMVPFFKMLFCSLVMAISLYVPIKLLDQVVFDTTRTIGLLVLTGIAGLCGMIMYLFLTWLLRVREAFMVIEYLKVLLTHFSWLRVETDITESVDEVGK